MKNFNVIDDIKNHVDYSSMWKKFKKIAHDRGYVIFIPGTESFRRIRDDNRYIKMNIGSTASKLILFETGVGIYEVKI